MSGGRVRAWVAYAVVSLGLIAAITIVAAALAGPDAAGAIALAGAIAYVLQLVAFAMLLVVRDQTHVFMAGWLGGMVLRFGALGGCLLWASRTTMVPRAPLVLALVGHLFLLLLLEPVFLRWDLRRS